MSLNYNYAAVQDQTQAVFVNAEGEAFPTPTMKTVVFYTMYVGISHITSTNYEKFYERYMAFNFAAGYPDGTLSLEGVKGLVGLYTNADIITDAAFKKKLANMVMDRAATALRIAKLGEGE